MQPIPVENYNLIPPYIEHGASEVSVANKWMPWWEIRDPSDPQGFQHRPEFKHFEQWQKVFTGNATHKGGIYQRVQVTPGDMLTLMASAWFASDGSGLSLVVGIDPKGEVPMAFGYDSPPTVEWGVWKGETSRPKHPERTTTDYVARTQAESNWVTIYLKSECMYPGKDASAFWNNVQLYKDGEAPAPVEDTILIEIRDLLRDAVRILKEIRYSVK